MPCRGQMLCWVNRRLPNARLEFLQGLGRVPHDKREYSLRPAAGAASVIDCGPVSLQWSHERNVALSLDRADARVGRPLTATSVAGVHRRAYRRAYYY
jgi:hypothetical protein